MRFITPCAPVIRDKPPIGPEWLHEVKFDGWRVQIHRRPEGVKLFSRKAYDMTERFPSFLQAMEYLPECIIDGELVACDTDGRPDFAAISGNHDNLCIWCFDLLFNGPQDLRETPLVERKALLRQILIDVDDHRLRYSEEFSDPVKLLQVADKMGLEGIVSKRRNSLYRTRPCADWIKGQDADLARGQQRPRRTVSVSP